MLELKAKRCDLPALGLMARAEFLMQERAKHIPDGHSSHQGPQQSSLQAVLSDYSFSPWHLSSKCQLPPAHQLEKSHTGGQLWALQGKVQQRAVVPCSTTALNLTLNWRAVARWCVCQWETAWAGMIKQTVPHSKPKKAFEGSTGILFLVDTAGFSHSYPVVRSIRRDHTLYWTNKLSHGQVFFYKYNFAVHKLSWRAKAQPHVEEAEPAGDASTDLGGSAVLPTSTQRAAQLFLGQKGQITRGQQSHLHVKIPKLNPNFCSKSSKHCC